MTAERRSNRKAVAAYVFAALVAAGACGSALTTHEHLAAVIFGATALVAGAIAVFVGGPPPP